MREVISKDPEKLGGDGAFDAWSTGTSAASEANILFQLMQRTGASREAMVALIGVSQAELRQLARLPEAVQQIASVVRFRRRVLEEFDLLIAARSECHASARQGLRDSEGNSAFSS